MIWLRRIDMARYKLRYFKMYGRIYRKGFLVLPKLCSNEWRWLETCAWSDSSVDIGNWGRRWETLEDFEHMRRNAA